MPEQKTIDQEQNKKGKKDSKNWRQYIICSGCHVDSQELTKKQEAELKMKRVFCINLMLIILAVLFMIFYAFVRYLFHVSGSRFLTCSFLLALASFAGGLFFGFLFGIPRTLSSATQAAQSNSNAASYGTNTNMEQISDWLTKTIVGVSLVELHKIINIFGQYTTYIGPALIPAAAGNKDGGLGQVLAGTIIIFFVIEGFLAAYCWTRLYLSGIQTAEETVDAFASKLKIQDDKDRTATALESRQLSLPEEASDFPDDYLFSTFTGISGSIINDIFIRAEYLVSLMDTDSHTKNMISRTAPIFRALIKRDAENKFPENHEQLGYALVKGLRPDYVQAEKELTAAIDMYNVCPQGPPPTINQMYYYRAISRIKNFDTNKTKSGPDKIADIRSDLSNAAKEKYLNDLMSSEPIIQTWKTANP